MKIVVCIKQVPPLDKVSFDERTKRVRRDDVAAITNPLDLQALAHALELREANGGQVVALGMGPPSASAVLEDAVRRGADRAVHLLDRRFAGADTLATARALVRAIEREQPDLVLCGRHTLDGATAQVGPQVAELAGLPQCTQAIRLALRNASLHVERETERGRETWSTALPAVVSISRGPPPPEPNPARDAAVEQLTAEELGGTARDYGTRGSPTFVRDVRAAAVGRDGERTDDLEEAADRIMALVVRANIGARESPPPPRPDAPKREIWVVAERDGEDLQPTSLEGLACAHSVADRLSAEVVAILPCASPGDLPDRLAAHGADRIMVLRHPSLARYDTEAYTRALCSAIESRQPFALIAPWSTQGRDYAPRVAARLRLGLTGDFVALEVVDDERDDPDLMWIKPALAAAVDAQIIAHTTTSLGTLRPGSFRPFEPSDAPDVEIDEVEAPDAGDHPTDGPACTEEQLDITRRTPLPESATLVVGVAGELGARGIDLARRLSSAMGGAYCATTSIVKDGLAPPQLEIGPLSRSIAPDLYLGLGDHDREALSAIHRAGTIVIVANGDASEHHETDLRVAADPMVLGEALLARLERSSADA